MSQLALASYDSIRRWDHKSAKRKVWRSGFCDLSSLIIFILIAIGTSGCTTSTKYLLSNAEPKAPIAFNIEATKVNDTGATLHTVIFCSGPGSWKEKALWDEYVLTIENGNDYPVTILDAQLFDLRGTSLTSSADPWALEKLSSENWKHYGETGLHLVAGTIAAGGVASIYAFEYYLLGSASAGVVAALVPVVVVASVWDAKSTNSKNKALIETEFERRRLQLPTVIPEADTVSGCLFFPQCPGPQKLVLWIQAADSKYEVEFDLTNSPLSTLHLAKED